MQDVYHSVYLLQRCPGSPSCRALRRRRAIQDILSSLQTCLQRQTYSAKTEGPGAHGRERVGTKPPQSYEAVLQAICQKAFETAEALCQDLERLGDDCRGRSQVHSQIKGQEMEEPEGGHQPSPTTIFSHVLNPPADRQEAEESSARPWDRAIKGASSTPRLE